MKTMMKGLLVALLLIASGAVVLAADNAPIQDEPLPPEVKKLIGMKIPPKALGRRGDVPGWSHMWGAEIEGEKGFGVFQQDGVVILVIESVIKQSTTILDARVIPGKLLRFYMEDGKLKWRKNEMQWYRITETCWRDSADKNERILGMWRYVPDSKCSDSSTLVKKAWLLNMESGRLTDIPVQGVTCSEPICGDN